MLMGRSPCGLRSTLRSDNNKLLEDSSRVIANRECSYKRKTEAKMSRKSRSSQMRVCVSNHAAD